MKCPECKVGEIVLYKEIERVMYIPLNKDNSLSKQKKRWTVYDHNSDKDYLECKECTEMFDYEVDENGKVVNLGIRQTS